MHKPQKGNRFGFCFIPIDIVGIFRPWGGGVGGGERKEKGKEWTMR
jgi:hypothetical protein